MKFYSLIPLLFLGLSIILGAMAASLGNSTTKRIPQITDNVSANPFVTDHPELTNSSNTDNNGTETLTTQVYEFDEGNAYENATLHDNNSTEPTELDALMSYRVLFIDQQKDFYQNTQDFKNFLQKVYDVINNANYTIKAISDETMQTIGEVKQVINDVFEETEKCIEFESKDLATKTISQIHAINSKLFEPEFLQKIESIRQSLPDNKVRETITRSIELMIEYCVDQVNICAEKFRIRSGLFVRNFVNRNFHGNASFSGNDDDLFVKKRYRSQVAPDISGSRAIGCIPVNGTDPDASVEDGNYEQPGLEITLKNGTKIKKKRRTDRTGCSEKFEGYRVVLL